MDKYYFDQMAKFNKEANTQINNILKTITYKQWKREFSGFYKSVNELCSHIYFWDYNEFNRFNYLREFYSLNEKFKYENTFEIYRINISETGQEYLNKDFLSGKKSSKKMFENTTIDDYIKMRSDFDNRIVKFIDEITADDMNGIIKFTTVNGDTYENSLKDFLMNIFNHQTHHRGMISLYFDMLGIENEFNDISTYWGK